MKYDDLVFDFNKVIVHPALEDTINELARLNTTLPDFTGNIRIAPGEMIFAAGELVTSVGEITASKMDAQRGSKLVSNVRPIVAYDESIGMFSSLEGVAYSTSHSLVLVAPETFVPINYLTFYFYTRSEELAKRSIHIKHSENPEMDSQIDRINDEIKFLHKVVPEKAILLIDGPLIGGDVYVRLMQVLQSFQEKQIIPLFFVKNSTSNLVTDNIAELKNRFNSDMHWAYKYLKPGERTNFFTYRDRVNQKNAKVFCYLKAFDLSPQRIEFHLDTYLQYKGMIDELMNLIYYLLLVQGNPVNPQVRPIAVAEMYARETLRLVDIMSLMKEAGITPTMNQVRFGG